MSKVKAVLLGGSWDLTRMLIEDHRHSPLDMPELMSAHVLNRCWQDDVPTEAVYQIQRYFPRTQLKDGTVVYEYRPNE